MKNWEPFPVNPASFDCVLLTHAHIDHSGLLPKFVKEGFKGDIYTTHATSDLCKIMLRDSAHIQEEDARWANKKGFSKHSPARPLYDMSDAEQTIPLFKSLHYGENLQLTETTRVKFRDAGHILGSAMIDIKTKKDGKSRKILFSGDMGRPDKPLLSDPVQVHNVDYLIIESTYGNRNHGIAHPKEELARVIRESVDRGGCLVVPAFSVGRTQALLYMIRELEEEELIPKLPVYLDSPMAIEASKVFEDHLEDFDLMGRMLTMQGKKIFQTSQLNICRSVEESKSINGVKSSAIIISASGMVTGGRILHHLKERLPDPKNTVLLIGYQAEGTRGRRILDGEESVKIHGQRIPINAHVEMITGFSAHADYYEILAWLMAFNKAPEKIFIVHGESDASESLAKKIRDTYNWNVVIPQLGDSFELDM